MILFFLELSRNNFFPSNFFHTFFSSKILIVLQKKMEKDFRPPKMDPPQKKTQKNTTTNKQTNNKNKTKAI